MEYQVNPVGAYWPLDHIVHWIQYECDSHVCAYATGHAGLRG